MKLKVEGHFTLACSRAGCQSVFVAPYKTLKEEMEYATNNLDEGLARLAMESGQWRANDDDTGLVCPNHLDTGGRIATFGYDEGLRRNVVTLVLDEDEARAFSGKTFRVKVDP